MNFDKLIEDIDTANKNLVDEVLKHIDNFMINKGYKLNHTDYGRVVYESDEHIIDWIYKYNDLYINPKVIWIEIDNIGTNWMYRTETIENVFEKKKVKKFKI